MKVALGDRGRGLPQAGWTSCLEWTGISCVQEWRLPKPCFGRFDFQFVGMGPQM